MDAQHVIRAGQVRHATRQTDATCHKSAAFRYMAGATHAVMVQSSGKCALTLYSCIFVKDRVKINKLNTSIATGPLYVRTEFEAI